MEPTLAYHRTKATCVPYQAGDHIGKLLAYASLVPYLIILYPIFIAYNRRDTRWALVATGFVANECIARGLKHAWRHPRPKELCHVLDVCASYGMPSSHTMACSFAAGLNLLYWASKTNRLSALNKWKTMLAMLETLGLWVTVAIVATSRVYLGYHSLSQVLVASVLGMAFAALWHVIMGQIQPKIEATMQAMTNQVSSKKGNKLR